MSKARIWYKNPHWCVKFPSGREAQYFFFQAAAKAIEDYYQTRSRWLKAENLLFDVRLCDCSVAETDMIHGITKRKLITKKQYGWLRGIWERQGN